jgi:hypothetical protein
MKDKIDRQLNRIFISSKDMESAFHYFGAAERLAECASSEEDWQAVGGLLVAGIVAYGRPFSENKPHERAIPTPPFSESELTEAEKVLHRRLLEIRNKAVAHSDADLNPAAFKEYQENGFLVSHQLYNPIIEHRSAKEYGALARKIQGAFMSKMFALSRKVSQLE